MGDGVARHVETNGAHRFVEALAVFRHVDGIATRADHLHVEAFEHTFAREIQRTIQCGLATHGRQQRIGPLALDHLRNGAPFQRLDVGRIGHCRVGHDGRGIGVDENDAATFFAQRLTGLRAGVVELAGLADDDGARTENQNRRKIAALRHLLMISARPSRPQSRRTNNRNRAGPDSLPDDLEN